MSTEWNLKLVLEKDDDATLKKLREEFRKRTDEFVKKWRNDDSYLREPSVLKEALDEYEKFLADYGNGGKEAYYFSLKQILNQSDHEIKARYNSVEEFTKKISNDIRFFELSLAKISQETQKKMLSYPALSVYRHFLERLFDMAKHLLGEKEENIMNLKESTSYSNWVKMVEDFLSREEKEVVTEEGKTEKKTYEGLMSLMKSRDKEVRGRAAKAFNEILDKYVDVAENEINSILANKKVDDELRGFERPDSSRHLGDDINAEVVDMLLQSVKARFSIAHRYYALKAKLLHVKKLKYYERSAEVGEIKIRYPYDKAMEVVRKTFLSLDPEFAGMLDSYTEQGQIDVFPRKGKRGGACCTGCSIKEPTFIMLNHNDKLKEVTTIAHELGHGFNNEFMRKKQNAINFGVPTSTAEVASTFMEDFVLQELLREADEKTRFAIIMEKIDGDVSSIFRQVALYMFEQELHEGFRKKGYLSKKEIGEIFVKHMKAYMGPTVDFENADNWWVYWGHIRMFFYVYSYASGILISKSLQNRVRKDSKFIEKVKEFLSAGTSASPSEIFKQLGIDIEKKEFWNNGLDEVESLLNEAETLAKHIVK
jgi:oligoendopeptidase F